MGQEINRYHRVNCPDYWQITKNLDSKGRTYCLLETDAFGKCEKTRVRNSSLANFVSAKVFVEEKDLGTMDLRILTRARKNYEKNKEGQEDGH